jgi:hypothetical protein
VDFFEQPARGFFSTLLAILGVDLAVAKPRPSRTAAAKDLNGVSPAFNKSFIPL